MYRFCFYLLLRFLGVVVSAMVVWRLVVACAGGARCETRVLAGDTARAEGAEGRRDAKAAAAML